MPWMYFSLWSSENSGVFVQVECGDEIESNFADAIRHVADIFVKAMKDRSRSWTIESKNGIVPAFLWLFWSSGILNILLTELKTRNAFYSLRWIRRCNQARASLRRASFFCKSFGLYHVSHKALKVGWI